MTYAQMELSELKERYDLACQRIEELSHPGEENRLSQSLQDYVSQTALWIHRTIEQEKKREIADPGNYDVDTFILDSIRCDGNCKIPAYADSAWAKEQAGDQLGSYLSCASYLFCWIPIDLEAYLELSEKRESEEGKTADPDSGYPESDHPYSDYPESDHPDSDYLESVVIHMELFLEIVGILRDAAEDRLPEHKCAHHLKQAIYYFLCDYGMLHLSRALGQWLSKACGFQISGCDQADCLKEISVMHQYDLSLFLNHTMMERLLYNCAFWDGKQLLWQDVREEEINHYHPRQQKLLRSFREVLQQREMEA